MLTAIPRAPRTVTVADLQGWLVGHGYEVTLRTIQRDLQALSAMFPLVSVEDRKPFTWSWQKDAATLSVPGMTPAEAIAFQLVHRFLQSLLPTTIIRTLSSHFKIAEQTLHGHSAGKWQDKVRIVQAGQALLPPKVDLISYAAVTDALLHERQVKGSYGGKEVVLHPLGLVQRGPVTYLLARAFHYEDVRLYAMHRLSDAEVLPEPISATAFDIDAYIAAGKLGFGNGKRIRLKAIFEAQAAAHLYESPLSVEQELKDAGKGRVQLTATVAETPQLVWWILAFGPAVEVLGPAALRRKVAQSAKALAVLYRRRTRGVGRHCSSTKANVQPLRRGGREEKAEEQITAVLKDAEGRSCFRGEARTKSGGTSLPRVRSNWG
jgi:predicted DNA-binding transcriptional regulator YafY